MNLTEEEVVFCLENILNITGAKDAIPKLGLSFLNSIILGFQTTLPFQNSVLMAMDPEKRHRPTLDEIKDDMLSKRGGLCYTQNVFLYYLLQAVGYEVYFCPATCPVAVPSPNNHIAVLVRNVTTHGDVYFVDVACGSPTFAAVSMAFDKESLLFKDSFLEYKFIKHQGKVLRLHGKGGGNICDPLPSDLCIEGFRLFYTFELQFMSDASPYDEIFQKIYTLPELSAFHLNLRLIAFPNKRAFIFVSNRMQIENDDHELDSTTIEDDEDLLKLYMKHFPQLGEQTVRTAIRNWRMVKQ